MPESSDPPDPLMEEIVAYLDGELSAAESARVEQRLASDEAFRRQMQLVERTWAALDELPQATVDDQFSRTTMQLTVEAAAAEVQARTMALPIQRRRLRASTAAAVAAAAALGFLVVRLAWPNPNRPLLADLPVIGNVDIYSQFENVAFLRMLHSEVGDRLQPLGGQAPAGSSGALRRRGMASSSAPEQWLREMSDDEKIHLRAKFNRFRELPEDEKQRLRALHQQIAAADDAPELQETMLLYQDWLGGLPPAQQFELREIADPDTKLRAVKARIERMQDDASLALSEAELKSLFRDIRGLVEQHMRSGQPPGREGDRRDGDRRDRPRRPADPRGVGFAQYQRMLAQQFAARGGPPAAFQRAVVAGLPERTRERFEQLPPREKIEQFMTWKRQALALQGEISQQELEEFFAEGLDAEVKAQLLSLPPGEMEQALRRRFRRHPDRGFDGPGPDGDWIDRRGDERGDGARRGGREGRPRPDHQPPRP